MNDIDKNEYNEIKSQLKEIRSIMNVSASEFRLIYAADNFRKFFFLDGIFSLLLPLIYQALLCGGYGSWKAVPEAMMWGFYGLIAVCWFIMVYVRTKTSIDEAKKIETKANVFTAVKQVLSTKLWLIIVPLIAFFVLIPLKYHDAFALSDYIPYIGMAAGLVLNIMGVMINEKEYSLCGLWILLSAAILFFPCHASRTYRFCDNIRPRRLPVCRRQ